MEKKQTAVDFAVEKLEKFIPSGNQIAIDVILEKAKEMEKQQIIDAFAECWKANMPDGFECKLSAKEYYEESFKQD